MDSARIIATVVFVGALILLGDAWLKKDQSLEVDSALVATTEQTISTIPQATIRDTEERSDSQPFTSTGGAVSSDYILVLSLIHI